MKFRLLIAALFPLFLWLFLQPEAATAQQISPAAPPAPNGTNANWEAGTGTSGTDGPVRAAVRDGDRLIVAGEFSGIGGIPARGIAMWDGNDWSEIGGGITGEVHALLALDGTLYVGGNFTRVGTTAALDIAAYDLETGTWSSLGEGIGGIFGSRVLALAHDGERLYAGGYFIVAGTTVAVNIAAWNPSSGWERVGTGADNAVNALYFDGTHLYAGGEFSLIGDRRIDNIARYSPSSDRWEALPGAEFEETAVVAALAGDDRYLYVGGRFSKEFGSAFNNVARFDRSGGAWDDMKGGVTNVRKGTRQAVANNPNGVGPIVVEALAIRGGDLFVGGDFDNLLSDPRRNDIDATNQPRDIVKWNRTAETWSMFPRRSSITGTLYPSSGVIKSSRTVGSTGDFNRFVARDDQSTKVYAFAPGADGSIYVGGLFDIAGPVAVIGDVAVDASKITPDPEAVFATNIAILSPGDTLWSAVGSAGLDGEVHAMIDVGGTLYATGRFIRAGTRPVNNVARLDRTTGKWGPLGNGITGTGVRGEAIAEFDGVIYVGGRFTDAGGSGASGLAAWNPASGTWSSVGGRSFARVTDLWSDGDLLAVVGSHGLAIWDGSTWNNTPGGIEGIAYATAIDGRNVYVGGKFSKVGELSTQNAAFFNLDLQTWEAMGGGLSDTVFDITTWNEYIYFGGNFFTNGSNDLIRWNRGPKRWERLASGLIPFGGYSVVTDLHRGTWGVYVGGYFEGFGAGPVTNRAAGIALWDGETFRTLGSGVTRLVGPGEVTALASDPERLHVAGIFEFAGAKPAAGFADWVFPEEEDLPPPLVSRTPQSSAAAAAHPDDIYWDDRFDPAASPPGLDNEVFAMATTPDGESIYVGGVFSRAVGADISSIALWDGIDWQQLDDGSDEGVNGFVFAIAIDGDDVWVGGQFTRAGSIQARNIAVWNRSQKTWRAVGEGISSEGSAQAFVSDIAIADGTVYVGGTFGQAGSEEARNVAVFDGTSWSSLGEGIEGNVNALRVHEGNLVAGGQFGRAGTQSVSNLALWNGNGWEKMGDGVNGVVNALETFRGRVIIGGDFSIGSEQTNLAVWTGSAVERFTHQSESIGEIRDLLVVDDRIYVGGLYELDPDPTIDSQKFNFGKLTNVGFQPHDATSSYTPWTPMAEGTNGAVNALAVLGEDVVTGGAFTRAGEVEAASVAGWDVDGRSFYALVSARLSGSISALAYVNGRLYGAGPFTQEQDENPFLRTNQIAWLGASGWHRVEGNIRGEARTARRSGDEILVGGTFVGGGGSIAVNILSWNAVDTLWRAITPGSGVASHEDLSYVLSVAEHGDNLYVGGKFSVVDTFMTPNIARYDHATGAWSRLGDGLNDIVRGVATAGDGTLYAVGDFRRSGATPINGVARWSGTAWEPLGEGITGSVKSIAVGDGRVYVGGTFRKAGGIDAVNVAAWNIADATWEPVGEGLNSDLLPGVDVLRFFGDRLFAGGFFRVSGADSMQNIARFDGDRWQRLGSGVDFAVFEIVGDRKDIYVAGSFKKAGGKASPFIALWHDPTLSVEALATPVAGTLLGMPNPTAGDLMIRYSLPRPTSGRIVITDATGREVALLYEGKIGSGESSIRWHRPDDLPAGVYFCRLVLEEGTLLEKVILVD